jgi:hypothetical protein
MCSRCSFEPFEGLLHAIWPAMAAVSDEVMSRFEGDYSRIPIPSKLSGSWFFIRDGKPNLEQDRGDTRKRPMNIP